MIALTSASSAWLADCVFLLLFSTAKFYSFLGLFDWSLEAYWSQRYLDTVLGLMLGTANVSNTITAIISLERCICVLSPFLAKKFFKTRYMAVLIAAMSVYVTGFYNLMTVKFATVYVTDPLTNTSHWTSQLSSFYLSNRVVTDVLNNYLLSLTIPCTSLGVVIVTTCITVLKLRSTLAWRLETTNVKTTSEKARQDSVTKTLLVVCFVYLTCISLSLVQVLARTFVPGYLPTGKYCNTFTIGQTLGHLCEVTNASSSFLIYVTMGTKFRETVKTIFGDRKEKKVKEHRRNILSIKVQPQ
ncbi:uncharacterized protein LOC112555500 [Pomacea canaliculata]|uniref:uncharacterized protein LOC112555500 n=1 Tax=Pomacea canaliculata TaxID=400727 RepID=UPI000D738883|nr:uncharacterized protein LOC112555500 [Pomacea canaliculata]